MKRIALFAASALLGLGLPTAVVAVTAPAAHAATTTAVTVHSTSTAPGISLKVLVLDNAMEAGGAGTSGTTLSGIAQASITPAASHSQPVFALADGTSTSAYTALSNNAFDDNAGDTTNFWAYADGHYTGTVTAGTPITLGSSAPTGKKQAWSMYEIKPTGASTPNLDASTPTDVHNSTQTATTANFTPPAGSVLVAEVEGNAPGSGSNITFSISNTTGLTWTQRELASANAEGTDIYTATVPSGGGGTLTWSPPPCGGSDGLTCTTINLSNTGSHQTPSMSDNVDYKLVLPTSGPLVGGLTIVHGHNVQVIGGEIDLTYPCGGDASNCMGFYIAKQSAGNVYMEGVWIHNSHTIPTSCSPTNEPCSTGDAIDVNSGTSTYNVTLQNVRADGISGCSGGSDHSDVLQPYQAPGAVIDIDHLTGVTNCQGLQIDPDLASSNPPAYNIKNVNIDVINNPYTGNHDRYGMWFTDTCSSGSVSLTNAYLQEPDGSLGSNAVWPDTAAGGGPSGCQSTYSAPTLTFHGVPQISGNVTSGQPTGGDYVVAGTNAGIGYVSPGYQ